MISAIVYNSKTGSCERYARELSRKLAVPCYPLGEKNRRADGKVVFVSWLMAGNVVGYKKAAKALDMAAVAAVGMAPVGPNSAQNVRSASKIPAEIGVFCLQGSFNINKLPLPMKLIMQWKTKDIAKQLQNKKQLKGSLSPQEQATLTMAVKGVGEPADWNVDEIVKWVLDEFDSEKILRQEK